MGDRQTNRHTGMGLCIESQAKNKTTPSPITQDEFSTGPSDGICQDPQFYGLSDMKMDTLDDYQPTGISLDC